MSVGEGPETNKRGLERLTAIMETNKKTYRMKWMNDGSVGTECEQEMYQRMRLENPDSFGDDGIVTIHYNAAGKIIAVESVIRND